MKKFFSILLSLFTFCTFAQTQISNYTVFQKTHSELIDNKWVTISTNQPCNYILTIDDYRISISVDKNHYWHVITNKGEVVDGDNHTVNYECQDRIGENCEMALTWSDKENNIASLSFFYPKKQTKWDFREK